MKTKGFTLVNLAITLIIIGVISVSVVSKIGGAEQAHQEAARLAVSSEIFLSRLTNYYQSSCRQPDFEVSLEKLKQQGLLEDDFSYPQHNLTITKPQTPAAHIHLETTFNDKAVAASFAALKDSAYLIDSDTVRISLLVATQLSSNRHRLVSMKALWGESVC